MWKMENENCSDYFRNGRRDKKENDEGDEFKYDTL
jgi:hypothetical protein